MNVLWFYTTRVAVGKYPGLELDCPAASSAGYQDLSSSRWKLPMTHPDMTCRNTIGCEG